MNISQFIRQKRQAAGLTLDQVSEALRLEHRSTAQRKETGRLKWKFDEVEQFAGLLKIPLSQFIKEYEDFNG